MKNYHNIIGRAISLAAIVTFAVTATFAQSLDEVRTKTNDHHSAVTRALFDKNYARQLKQRYARGGKEMKIMPDVQRKGVKLIPELLKPSIEMPQPKHAFLRKSPRKSPVSSIDELVGPAIIYSWSSVANIDDGGNSIEITKVDDTTIEVEHFSASATNKIIVNVNVSDGSFSIPANQVLWTWDDGIDVFLRAIVGGSSVNFESPISGYIDANGNMVVSTGWADVYEEEGSLWYNDGIWSQSFLTGANGQMEVSYFDEESPKETYNVGISQDEDSVYIYNFGNYGQIVSIAINEDNAITIPTQVGLDVSDEDEYWNDGSARYDYYTYAADWSIEGNAQLTTENIYGTITAKEITFGNWTLWDRYGGHYITGKYKDGKITVTTDEEFNIHGESDDVVIATTESNAALIAVAVEQGWIASNATEMTKADAAKVTTIPSFGFAYNTSLTSFDEFKYFTSVTEIDMGTFLGCSNILSISLPESITAIWWWAFEGCSSLKTIHLPASVSFIATGFSVFSGCTSLEAITVDNANEAYVSDNGVLLNSDQTTLYCYPINRDATSYDIPSTVTTILDDAFENCKKLSSITISEGLETIGDFAFSGCSSLHISSLPNSLKYLGNSAFQACNGITSISIGPNVETIGDCPFNNSKALTAINVSSSNQNYCSEDGVLMTKDKTTIIQYPIGSAQTSYKMPKATQTIKRRAFCVASNLTDIDFTGCTNLQKIELGAFISCSSLKELSLPENVEEIDSIAFAYCFDLTQLILPEKLSLLGDEAFELCWSLTSVKAPMAEPVSIKTTVFATSAYNNATLYVPQSSLGAYKNATGWSSFKTIEAIEMGPINEPIEYTIDDVNYILAPADQTATIINVAGIYEDVVVPETVIYEGKQYTVTAIAEQALAGSSGFNYSVSLPSTISTIAAKAFDGLKTSAIIWNSDTPLPDNALSNIPSNFENMLLYVNKNGIAPRDYANTVVGGEAQDIVLKEGKVFHCPQEFTASSISFTHEFTMQTVVGKRQGWETIVLPFDVMSITHASKGYLVPFESYSPSSDNKPFWLYQWTSKGFVKASSMQANTAYLISMPNSTEYSAEYRLEGEVTFSATNALVKTTKNEDLRSYGYNMKYFFPSYYFTGASNNYANASINSVNKLHSSNGGYDPGSIFINNAEFRNTYPFECFIQDRSANARNQKVFEIEFADDEEAQGIEDVTLVSDGNSHQRGVYTISGQLVTTCEGLSAEETLQRLPAGIYIINGKKQVVK